MRQKQSRSLDRAGRPRTRPTRGWKLLRLSPIPCLVLLLSGTPSLAPPKDPGAGRPNIVIITIDTLRADHLSGLGYPLETSPNLDRLMADGVNFTRARTVEPLTNPALCSMLTSLPPNRHGGTRNGLRLRPGLSSLPKMLEEHGYRTAAFVGNWTLRHKLSGLGEHFTVYEEVLTRARWFGLVRSEATAEDLTERSMDWVQDHVGKSNRPFLAWVHYAEPHEPYVLHKEHASILGRGRRGGFSKVERYDTEIAFVDAAVGELLKRLSAVSVPENTLIVFAADHGESLGEHDYWGHGRHLYEPTLRIPMALLWKGRLQPATIDAPSLITDIAPTVLGLTGLPVPAEFLGYDWTAVLRGAPPPHNRVTRYEAHKGAVISKHRSELARKSGLLEVAVVQRERKEIFSVKKGRRLVSDLAGDPGELNALVPATSEPTDALESWRQLVYTGLDSHGALLPEPLDEESIAALRSLGYVD